MKYDSTPFSRRELARRGWTKTLIDQLLGDPDHVENLGGGRVQYFWSSSRVQELEKTHPKVIARLKKWQEKRAEELEGIVKSGKAVFRRINDEWLVQGSGLEVGKPVTVAKRNGTGSTVMVTRICESKDGIQLAEFTRMREAESNSRTPRPQRPQPRTQPKPDIRTALFRLDEPMGMLLRRAKTGDIVPIAGQNVRIIYARQRTINDDEISLYGSDKFCDASVVLEVRYTLP